jgi:hypothetical protein
MTKDRSRHSASSPARVVVDADLDNDHCITEKTTAHGYWWRYRHSQGEPQDTLTAAIMIASDVAATEARKTGKTYVVASTPQPSPAVYVLACDHPDAGNIGINIMYEFSPTGDCIRRPGARTVMRH